MSETESKINYDKIYTYGEGPDIPITDENIGDLFVEGEEEKMFKSIDKFYKIVGIPTRENVDSLICTFFIAFKSSFYNRDFFTTKIESGKQHISLEYIIRNIQAGDLSDYLTKLTKLFVFLIDYSKRHDLDGSTKLSQIALKYGASFGGIFLMICTHIIYVYANFSEKWGIASMFVLVRFISEHLMLKCLIDSNMFTEETVNLYMVKYDSKIQEKVDFLPDSPIVVLGIKFPRITLNALKRIISEKKLVGDQLKDFLTNFLSVFYESLCTVDGLRTPRYFSIIKNKLMSFDVDEEYCRSENELLDFIAENIGKSRYFSVTTQRTMCVPEYHSGISRLNFYMAIRFIKYFCKDNDSCFKEIMKILLTTRNSCNRNARYCLLKEYIEKCGKSLKVHEIDQLVQLVLQPLRIHELCDRQHCYEFSVKDLELMYLNYPDRVAKESRKCVKGILVFSKDENRICMQDRMEEIRKFFMFLESRKIYDVKKFLLEYYVEEIPVESVCSDCKAETSIIFKNCKHPICCNCAIKSVFINENLAWREKKEYSMCQKCILPLKKKNRYGFTVTT